MRYGLLVVVLCWLSGCVSLPQGVRPVDGFRVESYLGRWYEIARLDHSFERGMTQVTAEYLLRDDGGLQVINRGYLAGEKRWKQADGRAYFVGASDTGFLKVSFFGPFYGSYIVFDLDRIDYQYSLVAGPDKSYLWILARQPQITEATRERLLRKATEAGFDVSKLIWVEQR